MKIRGPGRQLHWHGQMNWSPQTMNFQAGSS